MQTARPDFLAGEIKGRQLAVPVEEVNRLAIRHRRRRCIIAFVVLSITRGDFISPKLLAGFAIKADRYETALGLVDRTHEYPVFPYDRRRRRSSGHRRDPLYLLGFRKDRRQALLARRAIEVRPAPMRPITCLDANANRQEG